MKRITYAPVDVTPDYGQPSSLVSQSYSILGNTAGTSNGLGNNSLRLAPIKLARACTIEAIGLEITVVGDVGSTVRLGIYRDNGSFYPGALVLDAGNILGDSATLQEITTNLKLAPGVYWIGAVVQNAPVTQPTIRITQNAMHSPPGPLGSTLTAATVNGVMQTGVSAGLPASFSTTITSAVSIPRMLWKIA